MITSINGSETASLEVSSDFYGESARCSVRVFERFSSIGRNRVNLNVTRFQSGDEIRLSAINSGGSCQALFVKLNTWGEKAFLDKLVEIVEKLEVL